MKNPTAAILIIGNEILSGRTQDVNVQFIARRLADLGIKLEEARVVPDIPARIIGAVNELRAAYTCVFTTGGIGPTHDDITSECIAAAFGVPWVLHEETAAIMRERWGEDVNDARLRMATMPQGAVPIKNEASIAPGFTIGNVHVMAGVPRIMQSMFLALEQELPRGRADRDARGVRYRRAGRLHRRRAGRDPGPLPAGRCRQLPVQARRQMGRDAGGQGLGHPGHRGGDRRGHGT